MSDTALASTYLSPAITTISDLVFRTKSRLGFPIQDDELTHGQWLELVRTTLEIYTQFGAGADEQYLVWSSDQYVPGCGIKLDDIISYGCTYLGCYTTTVVETITSSTINCVPIETKTAYLSVTPFVYPTEYNVNDPQSVAFSGISGQYLYLNFDPRNPWQATDVCQADCITINPVSSQYYQLSSNYSLSSLVFDFVNDASLSPYASSVSAYTAYPLTAVPLSTMGTSLSSVPIDYYDIDVFYQADKLYGPPMEACVDIGKGRGYIYPKCNTQLINSCSALSAQYDISPLWNYVLTSVVLSSVTASVSSPSFSTISSYFSQFCEDCNCNCAFLSTYNASNSSYYFKTYKDVISGANGQIFDLSATDISKATHVRLNGIPSCTINGSIPLISNDGIVASFVLCNSSISTNGPMYMDDVQFFKDYTLPEEATGKRCDWSNNGFTMSYYNSAYGDCVRYTPEKIKVDVSFCKRVETTYYGTVSTEVSANWDDLLLRKRKIHGVFSVDDVSGAGGGFFGGSGGDVLFNFDYALMGSVFGYDLQGQRNFGHPGGFNLTTYHMARSFIEHTRKMLRYVSYSFNPKTQYLKVHPEPRTTSSTGCTDGCSGASMSSFSKQAYIIGVKVEPPVEQMLSEYFVQEYVLALAMQTIGMIRSKFGNTTLYSGQTLNGDALYQQGTARIEQLMKELRDEFRFSEMYTALYIG
jgi:hypothetical protein